MLGFRRGVIEILALLRCYAAWIDSFRPFGTDSLSQNVGYCVISRKAWISVSKVDENVMFFFKVIA